MKAADLAYMVASALAYVAAAASHTLDTSTLADTKGASAGKTEKTAVGTED